MPVYKLTSEITINKPASSVFAFLTTVKNWGGLHPCTKEIVGPASINVPAVVGNTFTEIVETPDLSITFNWEVRKIIQDEYFEIIFPAEFRKGPMNEMIVTYSLTPVGKDKCLFERNMINFVRQGVKIGALEETELHDLYMRKVKALLEGH